MPPTPPAPHNAEETVQERSALSRFSGVAVQMVAIIGLSTWAGIWLDGHFRTSTPWYTIGLALTGVTLAMIQVIRAASQP